MDGDANQPFEQEAVMAQGADVAQFCRGWRLWPCYGGGVCFEREADLVTSARRRF